MKNYDERIESIFRKYDERLAAKKRRKAAIIRRSAALCLGASAVLGIGIFTNVMKPPKRPTAEQSGIISESSDIVTTSAVTAAETTAVNTTAATAKTTSTGTVGSGVSATVTTASKMTTVRSSATASPAKTTGTRPHATTAVTASLATTLTTTAPHAATTAYNYEKFIDDNFLTLTVADNGIEYETLSLSIDPKNVGSKIKELTLTPTVSPKPFPKTVNTKVYAINNVSTNYGIAVKFEGLDKYILYRNTELEEARFKKELEGYTKFDPTQYPFYKNVINKYGAYKNSIAWYVNSDGTWFKSVSNPNLSTAVCNFKEGVSRETVNQALAEYPDKNYYAFLNGAIYTMQYEFQILRVDGDDPEDYDIYDISFDEAEKICEFLSERGLIKDFIYATQIYDFSVIQAYDGYLTSYLPKFRERLEKCIEERGLDCHIEEIDVPYTGERVWVVPNKEISVEEHFKLVDEIYQGTGIHPNLATLDSSGGGLSAVEDMYNSLKSNA